METKEIRVQKLRDLVEQAGGIAAFARRNNGVDPTYVSQLLNGHRSFGEKAARNMEQKVGLQYGYFDRLDVATSVQEDPAEYEIARKVQVIDDSDQNAHQIRRVKFNVESGIENDEGNPIFFRKNWMDSRGYKPENLIAIYVHGNSMEPGLYDGDTVVINTSDTEPIDGEVFVVNYENETVIKRLIRDSGRWWLSSDNSDQRRFPRKECNSELCSIIGRVVHKQSEKI